MKNTVILILSIFVAVACKRPGDKVSCVDLEPCIVIDELSDSTFFKDVLYMVYDDTYTLRTTKTKGY